MDRRTQKHATPRGGTDDQFLTPAQLAELLQVPVKTLASWRTEKKGPPFGYYGKYVRYRKAKIDQWIEDRESESQNWMQS